MKTRCKFECVGIRENADSGAVVTFETRYCPEVEEDVRFTKWTPWGELRVSIDNSTFLSSLKIGQQYYIDISGIDQI